MKVLKIMGVALLLFSGMTGAWAHKTNDSYLSAQVDGAKVRGTIELSVSDLSVLRKNEELNGTLPTGTAAESTHELEARAQEYALKHIHFFAPDACKTVPQEVGVSVKTSGIYVSMAYEAQCSGPIYELKIENNLFLEDDVTHRALLSLSGGGHTTSAIFANGSRTQSFTIKAFNRWTNFIEYWVNGIFHIWDGIDHLLFLCALLLPSVFLMKNGKFEPVAKGYEAFKDILKIVTGFTVAHSITLSAAAFGLIELPTRVTESAIALSVILAALNNIRPILHDRAWMMAFGFGLIHGFGFATALSELGLPKQALAISLVGFNLGVETGQLALVCVFMPLIYGIRKTQGYLKFGLFGGSLVIIGISSGWLVERVFEISFMPF